MVPFFCGRSVLPLPRSGCRSRPAVVRGCLSWFVPVPCMKTYVCTCFGNLELHEKNSGWSFLNVPRADATGERLPRYVTQLQVE